MTDDLLPIDYVVVTAENIASKLHGEYIRLVTKYHLSSQTERWCAGIALGPNAYLSFKHWCASVVADFPQIAKCCYEAADCMMIERGNKG